MKTFGIGSESLIRARGIFSLVLLLSSSLLLQAQDYTYSSGDGGIAITGYTGPGGNVAIPATIDGQPVTSIARGAFQYNQSITNVVIPNGVTNIDQMGMSSCDNLASVVIPGSVVKIGAAAFEYDKNLAGVRVPNGVIDAGAFRACGLTNAMIGAGVTSIGTNAFEYCAQLDNVYFEGNAPSVTADAFVGTSDVAVHYKSGTSGWGPTFAGLPTDVWNTTGQTNATDALENRANPTGPPDH